ncbi:hypothetical protein [Streptococcus oricebi]|uniref:Uncharacterized protein n=1 Tax=Streptococcus oricebi TaxID=1547447 RepID=A0ABS5B4D4_9STRE|nr:hypothetical protein [Streptococcus oricebi]MBP2623694.1 hypothetical protein [Streptococcus oricebi]
MTERNLAQVEEDLRQVDRQLEELDRKERELLELEQEVSDLQRASFETWADLDQVPLSKKGDLIRQDFLAQLSQNNHLLAEDLDQRWQNLKKAKKQAEDRFEHLQIERKRLYRLEDERNKENANGN